MSARTHAVFLSGPIGVGKTTLGRALAQSLGGGFIDGDDFSDADKPWYCSILRTSAAIVAEARTLFQATSTVVIAYPLGCVTWIYFRRRFSDSGIAPIFVSLRASFDSIDDAERQRTFTDDEKARIKVMIAEGYGERPFSDVIIDTDQASFNATLARLASNVGRLMRADRP